MYVYQCIRHWQPLSLAPRAPATLRVKAAWELVSFTGCFDSLWLAGALEIPNIEETVSHEYHKRIHAEAIVARASLRQASKHCVHNGPNAERSTQRLRRKVNAMTLQLGAGRLCSADGRAHFDLVEQNVEEHATGRLIITIMRMSWGCHSLLGRIVETKQCSNAAEILNAVPYLCPRIVCL